MITVQNSGGTSGTRNGYGVTSGTRNGFLNWLKKEDASARIGRQLSFG